MNTEVNSIFHHEGFIPTKHLNVPLQEPLQGPDSKSHLTIMPEPSQNFENPHQARKRRVQTESPRLHAPQLHKNKRWREWSR